VVIWKSAGIEGQTTQSRYGTGGGKEGGVEVVVTMYG